MWKLKQFFDLFNLLKIEYFKTPDFFVKNLLCRFNYIVFDLLMFISLVNFTNQFVHKVVEFDLDWLDKISLMCCCQ